MKIQITVSDEVIGVLSIAIGLILIVWSFA